MEKKNLENWNRDLQQALTASMQIRQIKTHITTMKSKKQRRKMLPQGIPLLSTSILNHSLELRVSVAARLPVAPTIPNTHIQTSTQHTL